LLAGATATNDHHREQSNDGNNEAGRADDGGADRTNDSDAAE
jgi:hypothetical protein